jgi:3-hydroxymyristoyl/3-hydroxydecanoyl-(acyl carrier protein) dehydratase
MNITLQPPVTALDTVVSTGMREQLLVSGTDIFALGHYPGNPIYPGVLIAGALCDLAGVFAGDILGGPARAVAIQRIQYLDAVVPGDVVELVTTISSKTQKQQADQLYVTAVASVGNVVKTRATIICRAGSLPVAKPVCKPETVAGNAQRIDHRALASILPHRYPFLLLDVIEDYQHGLWLRARKVVNRRSPLFPGETPDTYPHSFVIESIGQAGIALYFLSRNGVPADIVLGSFSDAQIFADIPFDSVLTIEARIERQLENGVVLSGAARVGNQTVMHVASLIAMIDPR